jgi:DNA helicase-2/ATP-dependent DNA helicase PcrA
VDIDVVLSELNSEQQSAVTHDSGSMLVLAGAGSGKTKVLTTRIAWLIKNHAIDLSDVLAVTFTNKAAKEMNSRISELLDVDTKGMWIGTFHAIALKILTTYADAAGLPRHFQILDMQDQLNVLKRIIKNANLDEERYPPKELQKFIGQHKEQGLRASELVPDGLRQIHWVNLYADYELLCNREGLVDFTELLLRSYELLKTNQPILKKYHQQFKHVLVDEFQDTNHLQYKWLSLLSSPVTSVFAVGDDDQSIYSFRGAQVANMKSFLQDFKVKSPIRLEQNYRSTPNILNAANAVIGNNDDRIGKNLWTNNALGDNIRLYEGYTEEDEAYFVSDEIVSLKNSGANLSEIAILYRSNAQSRIFEQYFYNRAIPYRVYGGLRFFDRQEIKLVLCYLRLIINNKDNDAFLRVVNFPARGIGAKTIELLQEVANTHKLSLFEASSLTINKAKLLLGKFTDLIIKMQTETVNLTLPDIIQYVIEESGVREHYLHEKKSGSERLENLNELVNAVANFQEEDGVTSLSTFLTHAVLESGDGQANKYDQSVQLMTVHAAKGLEFKVVFLVGLEDGLFPHNNSLNSDATLQEERRLMYVAITRAKETLYILRACSRLMWGKRQSAPLSRFVDEIPNELISNISGISSIGSSSLYEHGADTGYNGVDSLFDADITNPENKTSRVKVSNNNCDLTLKIGDIVLHAKFGKGKIVKLHSDAKKTTAEIFFIGLGKKTLDLNIAKIEKLNN